MRNLGWIFLAAQAVVLCAPAFEAATFSVEVTPPLGHACMGGGISPALAIIDPLYARGVVILGPEKPVVLVSIDWCEIRNDAFDAYRDALASAAGTTRDRVLLSSVHVHDAPVVDFSAQRLLDEHGLHRALCDVDYVRRCIDRTAASLRDSLRRARPVTHYGIGQAEVKELASNRRYIGEDGRPTYSRTSATANEAIRAFEVGEHDPYLKTLSFWNGDTPVAALHAYAVHPMSYYGKGGVSADFVGLARRRRQDDDPSVFQVYFSGCSGDVVAGKWNDGNPANRPVLADKLYQGMVAAWDATERFPLEAVTVRVAELRLEPKASSGFTEEDMRGILADPDEKIFRRILAAMGLSWRLRVAAGQSIEVPAIDFGKAQFLLMPAESFVGYQLIAQQLVPESFVITAGYGECAPGYIPTAFAASEGFNDDHEWCWVAPGSEVPIREAMNSALGVRP